MEETLDENKKKQIREMFVKYFQKEELQDIVKSVETDSTVLKQIVEDAFKKKIEMSKCLYCNKEVHFRSSDSILVSGGLIKGKDRISLYPFCNKTCLKNWVEENLK